MSVVHQTPVRNSINSTVLGKLDTGAGGAGKLVMQTSGAVAVATLTLSATSFGAASSGTSTANAIASDTNAAGGTIAKASFQDHTGLEIFNCSVTATGGGGDITLNSVVVSSGQTVSITSLTYSAPP